MTRRVFESLMLSEAAVDLLVCVAGRADWIAGGIYDPPRISRTCDGDCLLARTADETAALMHQLWRP